MERRGEERRREERRGEERRGEERRGEKGEEREGRGREMRVSAGTHTCLLFSHAKCRTLGILILTRKV